MHASSIFRGRLPAALILTLSALISGTAVHATPSPNHHRHGLSIAPAGLVAAIARTQASEAAKNPAYAIAQNGCASLKTSPKGSPLTGCFTQTGPAFTQGKHRIGLHLVAWGTEGKLHSFSLHRTAPKANRIEYRGKHISEWWQVLPMGYEQGFTINKAPKGNGNIILKLKTNRTPTLEHGTLAWGNLHYGKLRVIDAAGHILTSHLSAKGKTVTLAFDASHASFPVTVDPLVWLQQEVTASDGAAYDHFGYSVALSADGTTALVGAYQYDLIFGAGGPGAAYVYTLSNGSWSQVAKLTATGGATGDEFGYSVALSGNGSTALVGAELATVGPNSQQGVAYVFSAPAGGWGSGTATETSLTATDAAASDWFGSSVTLSSDGATALVGASHKNSNQGAAYIFTQSGGTWSQAAKFIASDAAASDFFGVSVALSSNGATALVGAEAAPYNSTTHIAGAGEAYVYTLSGGSWSEVAKLAPSDGISGDQFGHAVALSGDGATALVGANQKNSAQGAVYVYAAPTGGWGSATAMETKLTASDGSAYDQFGLSVALSGNGTAALVGANQKMNNATGATEAGAAYLYGMPAGGWGSATATETELTANDPVAYDYFGQAVALSSDGATALVGADGKLVGTKHSQGAAYFLNVSDLSAVLNVPSSVLVSTQYSADYIVTNNSSTASADVQVQMPVPSGASYVSASATPAGSCTYDSITQVATCDPGSIGAGGTATVVLTLQAGPTVGATITQSASLSNNAAGSPNLAQTGSTTVLPSPPTAIGSNMTLTVNSSGSETLTLSGTGTLTVSASSSDSTLLPNANITGQSSCTTAGSCTLSLAPAANQTGTATVTVTVSDAYGQSGTGTFQVTVNPPAAPTITGLTNVSMTSGGSGSETLTLTGTGALTVTATSSDTTLLPNANITGASSCTAAGACVLTLTAAAGQTGTATVTVTVADAYGQTTTGTFTLSVATPTGTTTFHNGPGGTGGVGLLGLAGLCLLAGLARRRQGRKARWRE